MFAVKIDWDGVVANSQPHLYEFVKDVACKGFNVEFPFKDYQEFREAWREPYPEFYEELGFDWEKQKGALFRMYNEFMARVKPGAFQGIDEVFHGLRREGIKVAVVSSSSIEVIERDSRRYGLRDHIDLIVGCDSIPDQKKTKPHAAPLLIAQHQLRCYDGVYVGDMPSDYEACQNVERFRGKAVPCILVSYGYSTMDKILPIKKNLVAVVKTPKQLLEQILKFRSSNYPINNQL
ncbi:HAD hydrolase-like protein [Candidatus Woesearchaeota archaeon]|nr:HAD hydrolase-like protein [Candidatus Woesearchaeota archaeon]